MKKQCPAYTSMIFVLLLFSFTQCSKSDLPVEPTYTLKFSPQALAYVQQPLGKYRIYRDSATSALDSVVVTESSLGMINKPATSGIYAKPEYNTQTYLLTLKKMNVSPDSTWLKGSAEALLPEPYISSDLEPVYFMEIQSNLVPLKVATFFHSMPGTISKIVEGVTYNNVVYTTGGGGGNINDLFYRQTIYYWAPNIGLIQRTIITTGGAIKTYYLVRYN